MSDIKRVNVGKRMSDMTIFNGIAYLAGQVADDSALDMQGQTRQVLETIDRLLAEAGTDISAEPPKILTADAVKESGVVLTIGCGDSWPVFPGNG